MFALALLTLLVRLFIRIRVQKYIGLDDGFLLFAAASLGAATGLLFTFLDKMYLVEALISGIPTTLPPDFIQQSTIFHELSDICLILLWTTVFSVKFSFLALFRKLIDRNRPLTTYWKVVAAINAVVWAYGVAGLVIPCPHFTLPQARTYTQLQIVKEQLTYKVVTCASGSQLPKTVGLAVLLVVLDILTDVFSTCSCFHRIP